MRRYKTYQFIAKCLSLGTKEGIGEELRHQIESGDVNWNRFFRTGSNHLVLQTIYSLFKKEGLADSLPTEVHHELKHIYDLNKARNDGFLKQSEEINSLLQAQNIEAVFLKGVAHIMNKLYHDPAERLMADIDLLVPKKNIKEAVAALLAAGYESTTELTPDKEHIYRKHHPRLYKPGQLAYIEIHWEAVRPGYTKIFKASDVLGRSIPSRLYPSCKTFSPGDACIHNFIHSQLEHRGNVYANVYLRNMYDLLLLGKITNIEEEFAPLEAFSSKAFSYLFLCEKLFDTKLVYTRKQNIRNRIFMFRCDLNARMVTLSFVYQFLERFFISYLKKPFLVFTRKEVRIAMARNLSSKAWYRQHLKSYRGLFGRK